MFFENEENYYYNTCRDILIEIKINVNTWQQETIIESVTYVN